MGKKEEREDKKGWRNNLADFFELPKDVILDLPRITMVGNINFYLENHRGVIEYSDKIVRLSINGGEIAIKGRGLSIKTLLTEEIVIEGEIEIVEYGV